LTFDDASEHRASPLVYRIELGRRGVGHDGVHQECDRLLEANVAKKLLAQMVEQARAKGLTSDEHLAVDGTLLEAWAGAKSFQPYAQHSRRRRVETGP
jgi:hypothetical protein